MWDKVRDSDIQAVLERYVNATPFQRDAAELLKRVLELKPANRIRIQATYEEFCGRGAGNLRTISNNIQVRQRWAQHTTRWQNTNRWWLAA